MPIYAFYRGMEVLIAMDNAALAQGSLEVTARHLFDWGIGFPKSLVGLAASGTACVLLLLIVWNWDSISVSLGFGVASRPGLSHLLEQSSAVATGSKLPAGDSAAVVDSTKGQKGTIAIRNAWRIVKVDRQSNSSGDSEGRTGRMSPA